MTSGHTTTLRSRCRKSGVARKILPSERPNCGRRLRLTRALAKHISSWDCCRKKVGNWRRRWRRCRKRSSTRPCRTKPTCAWRRYTGGWGRRRRRARSRSFTRKSRRKRKKRWIERGGSWGSLWLPENLRRDRKRMNKDNTEFPEDAQSARRLRPRPASAPCRGGACSTLLLVGRRWRSWRAHQLDEHPVKPFEIGINQDFNSLE